MTKQNQLFRNFSKCIKNKRLKYHIYISIRPFFQYFVEAPLAAITASSLLGYDATSLAHLYLGSFSHFSLQILSSSVRLDGERHCTVIFRSLQLMFDWVQVRALAGHSSIFRDLSQSLSCVVLAMSFGSFSCWKVNPRPSLRS